MSHRTRCGMSVELWLFLTWTLGDQGNENRTVCSGMIRVMEHYVEIVAKTTGMIWENKNSKKQMLGFALVTSFSTKAHQMLKLQLVVYLITMLRSNLVTSGQRENNQLTDALFTCAKRQGECLTTLTHMKCCKCREVHVSTTPNSCERTCNFSRTIQPHGFIGN